MDFLAHRRTHVTAVGDAPELSKCRPPNLAATLPPKGTSLGASQNLGAERGWGDARALGENRPLVVSLDDTAVNIRPATVARYGSSNSRSDAPSALQQTTETTELTQITHDVLRRNR